MITEISKEKRLNKYGINIKTKYKQEDKILQRNTDNSLNENVKDAIILEKEYYYKGNLLKKENIFDSRITYSYVFDSDKKIECSNCGMTGNIKEFENGCPYCGTCYNIDYEDKELGSKYYYDLVLKEKNYMLKTYIIDLIISFIISFFYVTSTGRTFYFFDVLKMIVIALLISFLLFYLFYYLDAFILLPSVKAKKEKINNKQIEFWKKMETRKIDKIKFYNNLNYDIRNIYFSDSYEDIIDFDIIDYTNFEEQQIDDELYVTVWVDIRIVKFVNGKIISKTENKKYKLKHISKQIEIESDINLIKCGNCGASIDVTQNECGYCGGKNNYLKEWYIV